MSNRQKVVRPPRHLTMKILGWKDICDVEYSVPELIVEKEPLREQCWLAGLIEGEGSFFTEHGKVSPKRDRLRPMFFLRMTEPSPIERASKDLGMKLHTHPKPPKTPRVWYIATSGTPVIAIAGWSLKYMTPDSKRYRAAKRLLKVFAKRPAIHIYQM